MYLQYFVINIIFFMNNLCINIMSQSNIFLKYHCIDCNNIGVLRFKKTPKQKVV